MMISLQSLNPSRLLPTDRKLTPHRITILFGLVICGGLALYAVVSHLRHRRIQKQFKDDNTTARSLLGSGMHDFNRGMYDNAITQYKHALSIAKDIGLRTEINYHGCKAYLKNKQLDQAVECYNAVVQGNSPPKEKAELALEIGTYLEKDKKTDEARDYYDQAKANLPLVDPEQVQIFVACSQAYLNLGVFISAAYCCNIALNALANLHSQIPLRLQMGHIEEMQDKMETALAYYSQAENLLPHLDQGHLTPRPHLKMKVWIALSQIYRKHQDFAKALEYCERALTTPDAPTELLSQAHYSKGWILFDQNKHLQAEGVATTALDVLKSSLTQQADLQAQIFILQSHILRKKEDPTQADRMEREALALLPSESILVELHLMRALSWHLRSASYPTTHYYSRELEEYCKKNSTLKAFYLLNQALIDVRELRLEEAEKKLGEAAACSFDKPLRRDLLRYAVEPCLIDPALSGVEILRQTIQQKRDETAQLKSKLPQLGQEAYNRGDYRLATQFLKKALDMGHRSFELYLSLSRAYLKLESFRESASFALQSLQNLTHTPNEAAQFNFLRGQSQIGLDNATEANTCYNSALSQTTDDRFKVEIYRGLIQSSRKWSRYDKALDYCNEAMNLCKNDPLLQAQVHFSHSMIFIVQSKLSEAEEHALKALDLLKEASELKAETMILLSIIHRKQSDLPKAQEKIAQTLTLKGEDPETLVAMHLQSALCYRQKIPDNTNCTAAINSYTEALKYARNPFLKAYTLFQRAQCHIILSESPECTNSEEQKQQAIKDLEEASKGTSYSFVSLHDLLDCFEGLSGSSYLQSTGLKEKIVKAQEFLKPKKVSG